MTTTSNRGKYAESEVKKALKKLEAANCAHHRFPDAHAGSFTTAPADFMFLQDGVFRLLEVKQVQHDFRLPYANFALDQTARMRNWEAAGAKSWVLVCFMPSKTWRLAPASYFLPRPKVSPTGRALGSWDMSEIPTMTLPQALGLT